LYPRSTNKNPITERIPGAIGLDQLTASGTNREGDIGRRADIIGPIVQNHRLALLENARVDPLQLFNPAEIDIWLQNIQQPLLQPRLKVTGCRQRLSSGQRNPDRSLQLFI
jgi:hypothetical protein